MPSSVILEGNTEFSLVNVWAFWWAAWQALDRKGNCLVHLKRGDIQIFVELMWQKYSKCSQLSWEGKGSDQVMQFILVWHDNLVGYDKLSGGFEIQFHNRGCSDISSAHFKTTDNFWPYLNNSKDFWNII